MKQGLMSYINSYGDNIDWDNLKKESKYVAEIMQKAWEQHGSFSQKLCERQQNCAKVLRFALDVKQQKKKVFNPHYCGNRFCAICNTLKSRKTYRYMIQRMDELFWDNPAKYTVSFITVALKNCPVEELTQNFEILRKNAYKMTYLATRDEKGKKSKIAFVRTLAKGYVGSMRCCEATYNKEAKNMHPHMHIVAVSKNDVTFKESEIAEAYKHYMKLDYYPRVHVENVTSSESRDLSENLASIARYMAKGIEVDWENIEFDEAINVAENLYVATKGKNLISYHGYFQEGRSKEKLKEMQESERILDEIGEREEGLKENEMKDISVSTETPVTEDANLVQMALWELNTDMLHYVATTHESDLYRQLAKRIIKVKNICNNTRETKTKELNAIEKGLFDRIVKRAREHRKTRHAYTDFQIDCIITSIFNNYARRFVISKIDYFDQGVHSETEVFDTFYNMTDCTKLYRKEIEVEMDNPLIIS